MEDERKIRRNTKILMTFSALLNILGFYAIINNSEWMGFSGVSTKLFDGGVKEFLIGILMLFLLWWVFGALYASMNATLVVFLYGILHFRDVTSHSRYYRPTYEKEWYSACGFSIVVTVAITGILALFNVLGIMDVHWLWS